MARAAQPNRNDADIIIVGGGCAGLSLAARFAAELPDQRQHQHAPRVLVLEHRDCFADDRTFSQWRGTPHPFSHCVRASWPRWLVAAGDRVIERGDDNRPYESISAGDFNAEAQRLIAAAPGTDLRMGVQAFGIGANAERAWVETAQGPLRAELVIDTRPQRPSAGADGLLQAFTGCEITTDAPVFATDAVQLMMFDEPRDDAIAFFYILPYAPNRALLEYTLLGVTVQPPSVSEVRRRIAARLKCGFAVVRTESGTIAMQVPPRAAAGQPRLLRMGLLAGAARASTGYAFTTIQAQADDLAARLRTGWQAGLGWRAKPPPAWMGEMDRLFLRVLRARPHAGPDLFADLFERCPPAALIRFLSGTGGLGDAARVVRSLPTTPFARQLLWRAAA